MLGTVVRIGENMSENHLNIDAALEGVDNSKRATLRKLVIGSAFVVPAVTTFALDGLLNASTAFASNSNHS